MEHTSPEEVSGKAAFQMQPATHYLNAQGFYRKHRYKKQRKASAVPGMTQLHQTCHSYVHGN